MKSIDTAKILQGMYNEVETRYRPDLRWWLAEGLNTDKTLRKNVREIYASGFGAAEFLAMPENGADSSIYGWGSDEWTNDTRLIIKEATKLGLGFSLTSGAHWANANLPDTYEWKGEPYNPDNKAAAKELDYASIFLNPGESFSGILPLPAKPAISAEESSMASDIYRTTAAYTAYQFQGVVAARIVKPGVLVFSSLNDLTEHVKESGDAYSLNWSAPKDGVYALFTYWMHGTSQTASPSASTNYTINYVDRYGVDALIDYWEQIVLTEDLKKTIRQNGRGEIYMDSLELHTYGAGGLFWGYHFKEEFTNRKGYDITRYLPLITANDVRILGGKSKEFDYTAENEQDNRLTQKVRMDFYSVLTSMYEENVLNPLQIWLHSLNMTLRAEPSYGMPYEISTPARYIDGIETESFALAADIDLFRGMSGSAHMYGRVFSSETGAVVNRNYYYNMDDWTQLCYLQFAEGVNRIVFHGYSAIEGSESDTYWPGHEGMYAFVSERFNSRQPASIHYPGWTQMLARTQKVLRQGVPARDIAILRTDYAFINYGQPEGYDTFATNYSMHDIPHFWNDLSLQQAGYTYDYFSPLLLENDNNISWSERELKPNGPAYRAIIVYQEEMELSSAQKLFEIVKGGLPLLFVDNNTELISYDGTKRQHRKAASVSKYLCDTDEALEQVVAQMKALPNVLEIESPAEALEALQGLGVTPRVKYAEPNSEVLTMSRWDAETQMFYTFVYSYKFEVEKNTGPYSFTMCIEGEGIPYCIDTWTGEITKIGLYEVKGRRTCIPLTMIPGESKLITLNLRCMGELHATDTNAHDVVMSGGKLYAIVREDGKYTTALSNEQTIEVIAKVPSPVSLTSWDIVVEDWNEGDKKVNTEEKFGHTTTEIYYTTKRTRLEFKNCGLRPWKDLPATTDQLGVLAGAHPSMRHVSGIGVYTATFSLPDEWNESNGAMLWIDSAGGGTVEVQVNGSKPRSVDTRTLQTDISKLVKGGENDIRIEVTSTLTNRMLQRGYQDKQSGWDESFPTVQDYGLAGDVCILPYTKIPLI